MAPHAPFNHTLAKSYPPAPLHLRSFEPPLTASNALLKVDFGPTPISALGDSPTPTQRVPYMGIGPVELTGMPNFANASPTSTASQRPHQALQDRHEAAIVAIAALILLWLVGILLLCYFQFCRKKKPASKDQEAARGTPASQVLCDGTRAKNACILPDADDLKAGNCPKTSADSSDFSVETLKDTSGQPQDPSLDYFSLPLQSCGAGPPSPTFSVGGKTASDGDSAPATPDPRQGDLYNAELGSVRTPSPTAGKSRFTWDFKCAGGLNGQSAKDQVGQAKEGTRFPSLPPLKFNNPFGELMRFIVGPATPSPQRTTSPVQGSIDVKARLPAQTESSTGNMSASTTWTAISVAESLEELFERASGQPLATHPAISTPPSSLPATPVEYCGTTMLSDSEGSTCSGSASPQTPTDEKSPKVTLSQPNHRTLTPPSPALKQLLSAAGLSFSPLPTAVPDLPVYCLGQRSSLSSGYSYAGSRTSLPSPTSSGSAASFFLTEFPAVPLLTDCQHTSVLCATNRRNIQLHHRTMSDASLVGKERNTTKTSAILRASRSMPSCVNLAHWSGLADTAVKQKFD